jgi:hypothetical protein
MILPPAPAELSFLTDLIGPGPTLALIEAFAGVRVYVATIPGRRSRLLNVIGSEAMAALSRVHAGCYITPPAAKRWRAHVYRAQGQSYAEIALRLGVGERTVWKYFSSALGIRAGGGQTPRRPVRYAVYRTKTRAAHV